MKVVYLTGLVDPSTAASVRQDLSERLDLSPEIILKESRFGLALDPSLVSNAVAAIASTVSLLYVVLRDLRQDRVGNEWTTARLKEALAREMLVRGITRYHIESVDGFDNLLQAKNLPCKVNIRFGGATALLAVYVFSDGDTATLDLAQEIPADENAKP